MPTPSKHGVMAHPPRPQVVVRCRGSGDIHIPPLIGTGERLVEYVVDEYEPGSPLRQIAEAADRGWLALLRILAGHGVQRRSAGRPANITVARRVLHRRAAPRHGRHRCRPRGKGRRAVAGAASTTPPPSRRGSVERQFQPRRRGRRPYGFGGRAGVGAGVRRWPVNRRTAARPMAVTPETSRGSCPVPPQASPAHSPAASMAPPVSPW